MDLKQVYFWLCVFLVKIVADFYGSGGLGRERERSNGYNEGDGRGLVLALLVPSPHLPLKL